MKPKLRRINEDPKGSRLVQSPHLSKSTNLQIDRYAELTAELDRNNITSVKQPPPLADASTGNVDGLPFSVHRALQRRDLRLQLKDDLDRRLPAFKHQQRLVQQEATGFDLIAETNAMLDSKTIVATVLHEYRDECRARDGVERQVAKWSERLMDDASSNDDFQRLRAIELDDELVAAGEAAIAKSTQVLSGGLSSLSTLQNALANTSERIKQEHAIFFNKGKVKSSAINTEMTFDCGFAASEEVATTDDGDAHDASVNNTDRELLILSERRLGKRNEALQQALALLQKKDREVRQLKGNLELLKAEQSLNETKWKAIVEATASGVGFTQLWSMIDSEDASLEESLRSVLLATLESAEQQVAKKAGKVSEEVVQTRDKIQNMDQGDGQVSLMRERNEARMAARHAKARVETLLKEIALKEEMIAEKDNALRVLNGQLEAVQRVATAHRDDLSRRDADENATRLEMAALEEALAKEKEMHLEELRQTEERHRKREEELTASWLQARRDAEVNEHGLENRAAIKTSNLQAKIHELEDLLKTTRELNTAATARVEDLRQQLDDCGTAVARCSTNLIHQLGGCLSQLRSFNTAADLEALRGCIWRGVGDALMGIADLCRSDALSPQNSRRSDLSDIVAKIRPIVAVDLNPCVDDPRIPALEREVVALRDQNASFLAKLRTTASTHAENQDQYRRTIQHLKKAVINLVSRRNAELQALPSVKEGDLTSEQELNDLFKAGFQQLEAEDAEKANELALRREETAKAKSNIIELADSTALPVRQIVQVLAQMCAVLREVTSAYDKHITPIATRRVNDAKKSTVAPSEISLASSLLSDLVAIKSRNHRLIVEAVQIRAKAKGRVEMYTKQFLLADGSKKELVRRRMNHCEVQAFRGFADIYDRFSKLHEERATLLTRLASLVGSWQLPTDIATRGSSATPREGPVSSPVTNTLQEKQLSFSRRSGAPLSPTASARMLNLAPSNLLQPLVASPTGTTITVESPNTKPVESPFLRPNAGGASGSFVSPTALQYDAHVTSGSFVMGESEAVDAARLEAQSFQASYSLLRTSIADAFSRGSDPTPSNNPASSTSRRFAVLFDECPGSSKIAAQVKTEIEQLYTAMLHTLNQRKQPTPTTVDLPSQRNRNGTPTNSIIRTAPALETVDSDASANVGLDTTAGNAFWFAMRYDAGRDETAKTPRGPHVHSPDLLTLPTPIMKTLDMATTSSSPPRHPENAASRTGTATDRPGTSVGAPLSLQMLDDVPPSTALEFDEYGFAKRKLTAKRLAIKVESSDVGVNTDMALLANLVVRLVRPARPPTATVDVPPAAGARLMPVGFNARSTEDLKVMQTLRSVVNDVTTVAAEERFVAPTRRPTSASRKVDSPSIGRSKGTPVELPPRCSSALSTLQIPSVLEVPVASRSQQHGPQEVTLFAKSAKDTKPTSIYTAIAGCLEQHRPASSKALARTIPVRAKPSNSTDATRALPPRMLDEVRVTTVPVKPSLVNRLRSANPETVSWDTKPEAAAASGNTNSGSVLPGANGKQMVMVLRRGAERAELRIM